jgi:pyruvate/2-oxoglutarate dehydrogenase complex dihydrolipoamide acyltransferase (E2) component
VAAGDPVARDQPLAEVETDKATVDIPSPVTGEVEALGCEEGALVAVGMVLVTVAVDGAARRPATPRARRLARELGVDIDALPASAGPLREADVRAGAATALTPRRGAIARRLAETQRDIPAVTIVDECDFSELLSAPGRPPLLAWVVHHTARALADHPGLNATFADGLLQRHPKRDLGIVVDTPRGALVPVIRDADRLEPAELAAALAGLAAAARAGTLGAAELRGSSFTVTSAGRLGALFATPLVNAPEVAILGVHRVAVRPAVVDGAVVPRRLGLLSCTFDHRVVEGLAAAAFLLDVIERVQAPPAASPRRTSSESVSP